MRTSWFLRFLFLSVVLSSSLASVNGFLSRAECTFEYFVGSSSMCGWNQDHSGADNFDWTRASGSTASSQTRPSFDHTYGTNKGFYMYMETSYPWRKGDKARFISPTYPPVKGGQCFQFWYHMYGQDIGQLNVYIKTGVNVSNPLWMRSGNRGNVWKITQISITTSSSFNIVFEGVVGKSFQGDIAIDDLKLIKSPCPYPVLDLKLQPERLNNVYYALRGSTFVLNCTIVLGNVQAINLTWKHNGEWLDHEAEQVDSATVQLKLSNTSRNENGLYWCGPKLGNTSQGVNISLTVADPPSAPRNLRYSVVGTFDPYREYRVIWSASSFTGGLPVNYSIKLCLNDSSENERICKKNFTDPECRLANVLRTDKDFRCVLQKPADFVSLCGKACNYTISVVAENAVGSATSWRYLPFVSSFSATPWPPLNFMVMATDKQKELRISWREKRAWRFVETEYTILYHAKNGMENKTKVVQTKTEFTLLRSLEVFMEYYVYLMVRFVSEGKKSAPSEAQGPRIVKTRAGEPDTPSKLIRHRSAVFPDNPALRNVTVEWKLADSVSWRGTPGEYIVLCSYYLHTLGSLLNCEYHVNATSNSTVLQRLDTAKSYLVYMKMCNEEKMCSPDGEPYIVKILQDNSTTPTNGGKLSKKQIALITLSAVVGCITALFAIYVIRKWRRGQIDEILHLVNLRNRILLPPPVPADYDYVDPLVTNDYDQLNLSENQL